MYILAFLVSSLFTLTIFKWLYDRRRLYYLSWHLNGPYHLPLLGSAIQIVSQEILLYLDKLSSEYTTPIRVWLGTKLFIYLDNVEDVEIALAAPECINREDSYQFLKEGLGVDGLFTLEGAEWRKHRKIVGPSFNYNIVLGHLPVFNRNSQRLIDQIAEKVNSPSPFDIRDYIKVITLDSFLEATLGTGMTAEDKKEYGDYVTVAQELISRRIFKPWFHLDFVWHLTDYPKILENCRKFSGKIIDIIMSQKLTEGSAELSFVERLIRISEENENFSLDDVKAETIDALTAASDTSAWSISFLILMLAMHPECQEKVVAELKDVCASKDSDIHRHEVENLIYMEKCINESLRLFPIVSLMARKCEGFVQLKDFTLPPGCNVAIGVRQIHRKREYWGDRANEFDPENFRPELVAKRHPSCFIPFSSGPRNCIGSKYAMIVMKSMAADLLRNFRFTTPLKMSDLQVRLDLNIFLKNGHMVQAYHRDF